MTIKQIINAINAHPNIVLTVYNCLGTDCLYIGQYEKMTEKMLAWEIRDFYINELTDFSGMKRVTNATIYIEYMEEYK